MLRIIPRGILALAGVCTLAGRVSAQATVRLSAGATVGTALVKDNLGGPITLKPAVAPTVAVAISHPTGRGYALTLEGQFGTSSLQVDDDGTKDDLGTLRTLGVLVLLEGPIAKDFRWQAGAGALMYRPSEKQGVFLDDSPTRWLLAAGATWSRALSPSLRLVVTGRYDFHTFTTRHLDAVGYSQFTTVQRGGLFAGVERGF